MFYGRTGAQDTLWTEVWLHFSTVLLAAAMLANILEDDALRLYSLIWRRTIACQMEPTVYAQV